ncbi:hypothetical protein [Paractinoplanes globisporus]|uniref:Uncharacterized protein n=1 Tax=Paractinoplanes globisporus TaxID=113565 RepID=A0ABW6WFZ6_9ACTN|nr:hypothetical protein [Actinoplanes globisporus]
MSQPAEITSSYYWDRLNAQLGVLVLDIDELFERVHDPERDTSEPEEPVPDAEPDGGYDLDREAELEDERRRRLDTEPGGGYGPSPDDPELDV